MIELRTANYGLEEQCKKYRSGKLEGSYRLHYCHILFGTLYIPKMFVKLQFWGMDSGQFFNLKLPLLITVYRNVLHCNTNLICVVRHAEEFLTIMSGNEKLLYSRTSFALAIVK